MIKNYIAVDVETTGLNPARDKLLEVGAVKVKNGEVCEKYNKLIHTGIVLPERITELTGITNEMQKTGEKIADIMGEFVEFCEDLPILGHNVQFDFNFLKQNAVNFGFSFEKEGIDTLKIARKVLPNLESRTLQALCEYYQISVKNAHRALDDAYAAHQLYEKLWEQFSENPLDFAPKKLVYSAKRQGPITNSQKRYLNDLLKYHKIEIDSSIEVLTRSETSRMIDHIILEYGKMDAEGRKRKD